MLEARSFDEVGLLRLVQARHDIEISRQPAAILGEQMCDELSG